MAVLAMAATRAAAAAAAAAALGGTGGQVFPRLRVPPAGSCQIILRNFLPGGGASGSLEACVTVGDIIPGLAPPTSCCSALDSYFGYSSEGFLGCPCLQQVWFQMLELAGPRLAAVLPSRMRECRIPFLENFGCPAGGAVVPVVPEGPTVPAGGGVRPVPAPEPQACADEDPRCAFWAELGECAENSEWMCSNCCTSCAGQSQCATVPTPRAPLLPPPPPEPVGESPAPLCVDDARYADDCPGWAGLGECDRNPEFMKETCKFSCGTCAGAKCSSKDPVNCPIWASAGLCVEQPEFMCDFCCQQCFVFPQCIPYTPAPAPPPAPPGPGGGFVNPNTLRIRQKLNQTQDITNLVEQGLIYQTGLIDSMNDLRNGALNLVIAEQIISDVWERRNGRTSFNTRGRYDKPPSLGDRFDRLSRLGRNFNPP